MSLGIQYAFNMELFFNQRWGLMLASDGARCWPKRGLMLARGGARCWPEMGLDVGKRWGLMLARD